MMTPNVLLEKGEHAIVHIATGSSYGDVLNMLMEAQILNDTASFKWTAQRMGYPHRIKPGRYRIEQGMSNRALVGMLRAGLQAPTRVTFIAFRTPDQLAQRVSNQIEADSLEIIKAFDDEALINSHGFTKQTFKAMFVPNTYEFFWNTNARGFFTRMRREYEAFWNARRDSLAEAAGLTRIEVITLASIVEEETRRNDEKARVAGVYMNRIRLGMPLQADPTIKFALGDFSIRRVLTRHLQVESPYNTYRHRGLPPGPICAPSIASIDAVLSYEKHNFLFFCAQPNFSGYHTFSKTLSEHNQKAREYHKWLNKQRIFR